jgi:hypothetical protein
MVIVTDMCAQCMSNFEFGVANAALIASAIKGPVHEALAMVGLATEPLEVARNARTTAFLRALDLDPAEALGAATVLAADRWAQHGGFERLEQRRRIRAAAWTATPSHGGTTTPSHGGTTSRRGSAGTALGY